MREELERWRRKRVFFDPLGGNHGDTLIALGSRVAIEEAGLVLAHDPSVADLVLVNGGASISDIWQSGLQKLEHYNRKFPDHPLIVLPSTFQFETKQFAALFRARRAPATLFARAQASYDLLMETEFPSPVRVGLDHDMAFHVDRSQYFLELQAKNESRHVLIVERGDAESATGYYHRELVPWRMKRLVPRRIRYRIKRLLFARVRRSVSAPDYSAFAREGLARVLADRPELRGLPVAVADISAPDMWTFEEFGENVARAAAVYTNRMHAGILAAMLGKPTYLCDGIWGKIRGVYEYSMRDLPHVRMVPAG